MSANQEWATHAGQRRAHTGSHTPFIRFDSRRCIACWKCLEVCPGAVFGKINLIIHKHAKIIHPDDCTGCRKCVKACDSGAITLNGA